MDVGRVRLASHVAGVLLNVNRRVVPAEVSQHGRDCCAGVDGVIGPDQLPYANIRWHNASAPTPTASQLLLLDASETTGLSAASDAANVRLRFALGVSETIGTAAAGAPATCTEDQARASSPGRACCPYSSRIACSKRCSSWRRRSFIVGVISPSSTVHASSVSQTPRTRA